MASHRLCIRSISLLRGINVIGKNATHGSFKKNYYALGGQQVTTYVQNGNVIFQAACASKALAKEISQTIQKEFGCIVPALIHEVAFFSKVVARNPFKDCDLSTLYVTPLGDATHQTQLLHLEELTIGDTNRFGVQGDVVYVHCPGSYGTTASSKPRAKHGPRHVTGKQSVSLLSSPCTCHDNNQTVCLRNVTTV